MKRGTDTVVKSWREPKYILLVFLFFLFGLLGQFAYLSLSGKVYGRDLKEFAKNRITVKKELVAKRGTIYDSEGNVLALNVASYTLIAYLDSSRTTDAENPRHVVDKEATAKALSEVLDAPYDYLLSRLQKEGVYQVEFGTYGSKLTELKKLEIEALELPGIDFIETMKRFYPNGTFASYIVGFANIKTLEENGEQKEEIEGILGVESGYNDILKGTNGSITYQRDLSGYQIPDTPETKIDAIDGNDIYLTIDANIQRFLETAVSETTAKYHPEWMILGVLDAKTGEILGSATSPNFDPNSVPSDLNYKNPLISYAYEPGSVMKTYAYLCAIDSGKYDGNQTYQSGTYKIGSNTVHDWNPRGWGRITYDKGYQYSSNVGTMHMAKEYLSPNELRECLSRFGFGEKTGVELSGELPGSINFNGKVEIDWLTVSFGQGLSTTALQQLQALTIIANDGVMVKPHIIKKIVNTNTGEVTETKVEKTGQIVKKEAVAKMKELMYGAINNKWAPGHTYAVEGFDVIGKTGTAQIFENGHYLEGDGNYLISFSGMYPKDDPQIIVYAAMKKPSSWFASSLAPAVKLIIQNISKYKNIYSTVENTTSIEKRVLPSYKNNNTEKVEKELTQAGLKVVVIGDGDTVIDHYPEKGRTVVTGDKVFLITNGTKKTLENVKGWSKNDLVTYLKFLDLPYEITGYGYVTKQSIKAGTTIEEGMKLEVELENKYEIETKEKEKEE